MNISSPPISSFCLEGHSKASLGHIEIPVNMTDHEEQEQYQKTGSADGHSQRGQWLRAAVLGANDGLVSVSSLMMGVGAVKQDLRAMLLAGFAGLVAGACSMAIGEFVSVYTQLDIELAQMKRNSQRRTRNGQEEIGQKVQLPSPVQAAVASALAFSVGAMVPLLAAAFVRDYKVRLAVVSAVASLTLAAFGGIGALLGGTPVVKLSARVLIGGWMAMAITFGLTRLIGSKGLGI